jgi:hypothetical protein
MRSGPFKIQGDAKVIMPPPPLSGRWGGGGIKNTRTHVLFYPLFWEVPQHSAALGGSKNRLLHPKSIAPSAALITGEQGDAGHEQDEEKAGGWQWLVYEEKVDTGGRATWASGVAATPPLALLLLTALAPTVRGLARAAGYRTADGKAVDASVRLTSTTCSALSMCCSKREAALLLCLHSALQHRTTRSAEKARGWQLNAALLAALSRLLATRYACSVHSLRCQFSGGWRCHHHHRHNPIAVLYLGRNNHFTSRT